MRAQRSWLSREGSRGSLPRTARQEDEVCRPSPAGRGNLFPHTCAWTDTHIWNLTANVFKNMHRLLQKQYRLTTQVKKKNLLTFPFCRITTYCFAHKCVTKIMHGNAQSNLFTQMNIVWNFFLCLKVIYSLVSHKNSLVGAIEHFVNYPSTLPDHWQWGGELDGETISYRLRYKTDPSRRRHRHKTWLEISHEYVMARWRVWLLN